ncbi:MAG: class I adenylate-forming enzyme family protein [Saccharofermentanales bacterium]
MKIKNILIKHKYNNNIAVIEDDTGVTYRQLYNLSLENSDAIKKITKKKVNIALLLPNSISYIVWYYSIILSDCIIVPIFYQSSSYEIANIINICDINIIISKLSDCEKISKCEIKNNLYFIDADTKLEIVIKSDKNDPTPILNEDLVMLLGTSGSFNNPKRVMLSNKNLLSNAYSIIDSLKYTEKEIFLVLLPLCFASANTSQLIVSLVLGAKIVIYKDSIYPRNIYGAISKNLISSITIVPSLLKILVSLNLFNHGKSDSLKTVCFGGGVTPKNIMNLAYEKFGNINLVHMYGQTEAATRISHLLINEAKDKIGSIGKPLKNISIKIVNENFKELEKGQTGEIAVRGNNVMLGYYKQPIETNKVLKDDWLLTGDIGNFDMDDYLFITGRKKNIIIYSGINIYPEEIENVLNMHESIQDVVVYCEMNAIYGDVPVADVVLKDESIACEKSLQDFCFNYLPRHKVPFKINFVDKLERTFNGKIIRKNLRRND